MKRYKWQWIALITALVIVLVDQITKWLVVRYLSHIEQVVVIEDVLNFTYVENPGAIGGFLAEVPWLLNSITTIAIVALIVASVLRKFPHPFVQMGIAFIIGGGIGNLIDRFFRKDASGYQFVVDFIDVVCVPFWNLVFNVADIFVVVGCMFVFAYYLKDMIDDFRQKGK